MKRLLIGATLAATLTLGACSSNPSQTASYADTIAQAKATHAQAAKMGNIWKQKKMKLAYVDDYIAKAEAAKKAGNDKAAMKNAQLALRTAKHEVAQMQEYANTTPLWQRK